MNILNSAIELVVWFAIGYVAISFLAFSWERERPAVSESSGARDESPTINQPEPGQRVQWVDVIVPFKRREVVAVAEWQAVVTAARLHDLSCMDTSEIRALCHQYGIPCPSRGKISKTIMQQLQTRIVA